MKSKKQLYNDILAIIRNNGAPLKNHLDISLEKGKMLAEYYNVDVDLVLIGIIFMDIKLGEAMELSKVSEHVKMGVDFTKKFLKDYDLSAEEKKIIINSIEAHHGEVPFESIEAEICANADCYRFIHPLGVFTFTGFLAKLDLPFDEQINALKFKLDEKYHILSLTKAKEELEEYYNIYTKQFDMILKSLNN